MVEHPALAQVVISEFPNQVPHRAPCRVPVSPCAYVSASVSLMKKINKILRKKKRIQSLFYRLINLINRLSLLVSIPLLSHTCSACRNRLDSSNLKDETILYTDLKLG